MPVAAVTSVLAVGLEPMFDERTTPSTTLQAAHAWAKAYVDYIFAGGIPAARARQLQLATDLTKAFDPERSGQGPSLFLQALAAFWIGMPVPAQGGTVTAFTPVSLTVNNPQPDNATPREQARGLAQVISGLTLGAVKVLIPPATVVPLL